MTKFFLQSLVAHLANIMALESTYNVKIDVSAKTGVV